jgi:hypothetical protein
MLHLAPREYTGGAVEFPYGRAFTNAKVNVNGAPGVFTGG